MSQILILSFVADDRRGLVEKLSEAVSEADGNWLESRMAHLAEKFAGIARVEVADDKVQQLKMSLKALEADGIHLIVEEAMAAGPQAGVALTLDLVGSDHPGIVKDIAHCLAEHGVSIEEMETDIRAAPMGGGILFHAQLKVRGPVDLDEDDLRGELERLSAALMIDIVLSEQILSTDRQPSAANDQR